MALSGFPAAALRALGDSQLRANLGRATSTRNSDSSYRGGESSPSCSRTMPAQDAEGVTTASNPANTPASRRASARPSSA